MCTKFAFLCIVALIAAVDCAPKERRKRPVDCQRALRRVDNCFKQLLFMELPYLPRSADELEELYCSKLKTTIPCTFSRRTCHKGTVADGDYRSVELTVGRQDLLVNCMTLSSETQRTTSRHTARRRKFEKIWSTISSVRRTRR